MERGSREPQQTHFSLCIQMVTYDRVMDGFQVDADLMSASCFRARFDVRDFLSGFWINTAREHIPFSDGRAQFPLFPMLCRPFPRVCFRPPYLHFDYATVFFRMSIHDRVVHFFYRPPLELLFEKCMRFFRFCNDYHAGSRSIKPMHDTRTWNYLALGRRPRLTNVFECWVFLKYPFNNRWLFRAPIGMHYESCRLINHEHIAVFVQNLGLIMCPFDAHAVHIR